jgi:hypothetical protein
MRTSLPDSPTPAPVPPRPETPKELLDLAGAPLFRGEYSAVERDSWHLGVPVFGRKVTSERPVAFTNEFNILKTSGPMMGYQASTLEDAIRGARDLAYDWSDPSLGGRIYASVAVAVLQAKDGTYYSALVGSGNPQTSSSALGYRSDRFDSNIYGRLKRATDTHATGPWSAPVDTDGTVVDTPAPDEHAAITRRHVEDVKIERFVPATDALKAIVDVRNVYRLDAPTASA